MLRKVNQTRSALLFVALSLFIVASACTHATEVPAQSVTPSSPTSGFVTANGIKHHYLDWGGKGEVLLLLTGFGDDARVFEDFAPKFTDRFHVIGLTRRGFGESEKPKTGYDTETRVEDIRQFLDALKINQVSFAGHSMAGDEMTLFATLHPQRVRKVVYLDAAYNRIGLIEMLLTDPGITPGWKRLQLEAMGTPEAIKKAAKIAVLDMPPPHDWEILKANIQAMEVFRTDYTKVKAPALAFYALSEHHPEVPSQADQAMRRQCDEWWLKNFIPYTRRNIEQFRREVPHGQIVELKDADHYVFRGKPAEQVIRQTREFLLQ